MNENDASSNNGNSRTVTYSLLSIVTLFFTGLFIIMALTMGGSSLATEPIPFLGSNFSSIVIVLTLSLGILFVVIVEWSKREENVSITR